MTITTHQAKYFAPDLTRRNPSGLDRLSMSLFDAAVDLNPHPIEAALFARLSPLSKRVVLADEVGLSKTIEAGIVLCQFGAKRRRRDVGHEEVRHVEPTHPVPAGRPGHVVRDMLSLALQTTTRQASSHE